MADNNVFKRSRTHVDYNQEMLVIRRYTCSLNTEQLYLYEQFNRKRNENVVLQCNRKYIGKVIKR